MGVGVRTCPASHLLYRGPIVGDVTEKPQALQEGKASKPRAWVMRKGANSLFEALRLCPTSVDGGYTIKIHIKTPSTVLETEEEHHDIDIFLSVNRSTSTLSI